MKYMVRVSEAQSVSYYGPYSMVGDPRLATAFPSFDEAHDLVEIHREKGTAGDAEVIPHPRFEGRFNPWPVIAAGVTFVIGMGFGTALGVWLVFHGYVGK
jgi:hypothetical protein